jgi:ABC-type sugar transport system ATPase subunit
MRAEILKVHRAVTATAVYVTHDQVEALTMGDRIVVMSEGRIQQVGHAAELYDDPINRFVAGFIGTPRDGVIRLRIARDAGATRCGTDGRAGCCRRKASVPGRERRRRGRRRHPAGAPGARAGDVARSADVVVRGTVEAVEMLGAEQYVHVAVESGTLTARVTRDHAVDDGRPRHIQRPARHLHLFDPATRALLQRRHSA